MIHDRDVRTAILMMLLLCGLGLFIVLILNSCQPQESNLVRNEYTENRWRTLQDKYDCDVFFDGQTGVYYGLFKDLETGSISVTPLYNVDGTFVTVDDIHTRDVG